ncbi:MAG: XdhC family protein [Bacillota bacterium]
MNQIDFLKEQLKAAEAGKSYAVVTIVDTEGSTSRNSGKMLVFTDKSIVGTIGGGYVEKLAIEDAAECIQKGKNLLKTYDMSTMAVASGIICDGVFQVMIEVFGGKPMLVMVGGGHVGGALIKQAKLVGFDVMLIDSRPDEKIADKIALADRYVHVKDFASDIPQIYVPQGSYYVIATWGHHFDGEALYGVLQQDAAYIGMIGNRQKINYLFEELKKRGVSDEQLNRVFTPIGLDIGGETPEEIAVAIMAEILMVKYHKTGENMKKVRGV